MLERAKDVTDRVADIVDQIEEARRRRTVGLILELDLTEPLVEGVPHDPVGALLARRRTGLEAVLDGLRRAARDPRVRALVAKVGGADGGPGGPGARLSLARAQELRDAVQGFRADGKLAVAWAESFGELVRGTAPYLLATGFDEIWLQPSGDLGLTGPAAEAPFLRGVLDKLGVTPQLAQRHEYKSAANLFTERSFTDAHREVTERLVASARAQVEATVAESRGLEPDTVATLVDRAPLLAAEAVEAGLVDRLGYRDEVYTSVRERVGEDTVLQYVARYGRSRMAELSRRVARARQGHGTVALVHVTGPIHLGRSGRQPFGRPSAGSDTVNAALRAAARDDDVKAIVLRVTSPGGSYVASDAVWRQVVQTREAGTPVVVSMGEVAASGGYYVAMGADAIVAEPATITGSIGVVAGKPVVEGLAARLGVDHDRVEGGRHALMFSPLQAFTDEEWQRLNTWLDHVYDDFVTKVAEARGLPVEQIDEVARGRVWTGADAAERGLVDHLGGLDAALGLAREKAGIPPEADRELVTYPRVPLVARLRPASSSEDPAAAHVGPGGGLAARGLTAGGGFGGLGAGIAASLGAGGFGSGLDGAGVLGGLGAALGCDAWGTFADLAAAAGLPAHGPLTLPSGFRLV